MAYLILRQARRLMSCAFLQIWFHKISSDEEAERQTERLF